MVSKEVIISKIVEFANVKLTEASSSNIIVLLARPLFSEAINNNISKLDSLLDIIKNKDGMIDIEKILTEMIDNLLVAKPTKFPKILGGATVGEGIIKINIPIIDKELIFDTDDIESFKQSLIKN